MFVQPIRYPPGLAASVDWEGRTRIAPEPMPVKPAPAPVPVDWDRIAVFLSVVASALTILREFRR